MQSDPAPVRPFLKRMNRQLIKRWWVKIPQTTGKVLSAPAGAVSLLLLIGLLPRIVLLLSRSILLWPDSIGYYHEAIDMLANHTIVCRDIFHAPLYPLFLALFLSFSTTASAGLAIIAAQHLLGLLLVVCCYLIARRVFGHWVAFFSALLLSFYPLLLCYECIIQTEVLFTLLLSVTLVFSLRALNREPSTLSYALTGVFCALTALTRPVAAHFLSCLLIVMLIKLRFSRRFLRSALIVVSAYYVTTLPTMFLNYNTFGFWGLSRSEGLNLVLRVFDLDRLPPRSNTRYPSLKMLHHEFLLEGRKFYPAYRRRLIKVWGLSPLKADRLMFSFALEAALAHPWYFIFDSSVDFGKLLFEPISSIRVCPPRAGTFRCVLEKRLPAQFSSTVAPEWLWLDQWLLTFFKIPRVTGWWFVLLSCCGVIYYFLRNRAAPEQSDYLTALLLPLAVFYFCAVTVVFDTTHDRYRLPVDPIIIMFGIYGIKELSGSARRLVQMRLRGTGSL